MAAIFSLERPESRDVTPNNKARTLIPRGRRNAIAALLQKMVYMIMCPNQGPKSPIYSASSPHNSPSCRRLFTLSLQSSVSHHLTHIVRLSSEFTHPSNPRSPYIAHSTGPVSILSIYMTRGRHTWALGRRRGLRKLRGYKPN
jgi:hypothetical protein